MIVLKCPNCGRSDYLVSDALAGWNEAEEQWELETVFDKDKNCENPLCPSKGDPISIVEEEV